MLNYMFLGQIFAKNTKNDTKTLFEFLNIVGKFEIFENFEKFQKLQSHENFDMAI